MLSSLTALTVPAAANHLARQRQNQSNISSGWELITVHESFKRKNHMFHWDKKSGLISGAADATAASTYSDPVPKTPKLLNFHN
jgi:hypothetical protein